MAEHPRTELLRLLKAFTPQGGPLTRGEKAQAASSGIRSAKGAVAAIQKSRGVSNKEAVSLLKQTGSELSAARKVILGLGRASPSPTFTSTGDLVKSILQARGSTQTPTGAQANLSPISEQVARFAATNEIGNPSGRLQVFSTRLAATAAKRDERLRNRPGDRSSSPLLGGPGRRIGR